MSISKRAIDWMAVVSLLLLVSVPWIVLLDPVGVAVWPRATTITEIQADVDHLLKEVGELKEMLEDK